VQDGEVHKMIQSQGDAREIRETGDLKKLQEKLEEMLASDPRLKGLRPHLMINLTEQGLRIQIIDSKNRRCSSWAVPSLSLTCATFCARLALFWMIFPNKISLAGHTDDMPYAQGERGYSNWNYRPTVPMRHVAK
jgi:chemotaxis protein MotB